MFQPKIDEKIIAECLGSNKECKNCIYCAADITIWDALKKKFELNSEFSNELQIYYEIKHKRISYEQSVKGNKLHLTEAEVPFFLRRS